MEVLSNMIEKYKGENVNIKLTEKEVKQILNGRIIEGHKCKVGMVLE